MKNNLYLSLGSNTINKVIYLEQAISLLQVSIGKITKKSSIYETPALGFDGDIFFNICLKIETTLSPNEVLLKTQEIEKNLGRKEKTTKLYTNRCIDIDILLYNELVIESNNLIIPHPRMLERKFVLTPLFEISSNQNLKHPITKKSVEKHLIECTDPSQIIKKDITLRLLNFKKYNFISIEGNIGAGKSSLSKKIVKLIGGELILEEFKNNPFLDLFYKDMPRYAFSLETSFLLDRYEQLTEKLNLKKESSEKCIISDYHYYKSLLFAEATLNKEEFKLYVKLFKTLHKEVKQPCLFIYLNQKTEQLQKNIATRNRDFEKNIPNDYLDKIHNNYMDFIKKTSLNTKIINLESLDFVNNQSHFHEILVELFKD